MSNLIDLKDRLAERRSRRRPGRLPWPARGSDLGLRVVDKIGRALSLDEEWSIRDERGFTWWGQDHAQRVWSESAIVDQGLEVYRLHARTALLRRFKSSDKNLEALNEWACAALTSGFVLDPEARTVELAASMYVHAQTASWVHDTFRFIVAIQAQLAQDLAPIIAKQTRSVPAKSAHPKSGRRRERDEMLRVREAIVHPAGAKPSPWIGEEMQLARELSIEQFGAAAEGDDAGLGVRFPIASSFEMSCSVFLEDDHAQFGGGAAILQQFPSALTSADGPRFALALNRRELESRSPAHYTGSWCYPDSEVGLCFLTFLPNVLADTGRGALFNFVQSACKRVMWVREEYRLPS
jgi:hypothetical protein